MQNLGYIVEKSDKPELIHFYNSPKSAVDISNQMCATYSTCRKTRRWALRLFYGKLNGVTLYSFIIYTENIPRLKEKALSEKDFNFFLVLPIQTRVLCIIKLHTQPKSPDTQGGGKQPCVHRTHSFYVPRYKVFKDFVFYNKKILQITFLRLYFHITKKY